MRFKVHQCLHRYFHFFCYSLSCEEIDHLEEQSKRRKMKLGMYTLIIAGLCFIPPLLTLILGIVVWYGYRKSEGFMLIMMKSIISQMNVNKKPTYLVFGRKLPSSSRKYFMIYSFMMLTICVQCFFLLVWFEVSYECLDDPDLDCFKEIDDVTISPDLIRELPVNCSTISKDEIVFCYRMTVFDPEKAFFGAAAAYLLFELLNIVLVLVSHLMLCLATKCKRMTLLKIAITLLFLGLLAGIFVLRTQVEEFESATRKLSYTALVQGLLVSLFIFFYVVMLPWGMLGKSEEYYGDASLPIVVGADNKAMDEIKK